MRRGFLFRSDRSLSRVAKDRLSQARRRASAQHLLRFEPLEDRRLLAADDPLVSAAPVVNAGPDQTVFEGATFAQVGSFIDTDSQEWTARVDYGDGSGSQALTLNADKSFQLNHTFPDDGRYTVSVAVTDGERVVGTDTLLVTVQNVIPSLFVRGQRTQPEGTTFTLVDMGMITDPGFDNPGGSTSERFTFTVDWGDGTAVDTGNAAIDVVGGPGRVTRGTFDGTHQYESVGKFTVSITAKDDNLGTSVTRFMTIETKNPQPTITALDLDQATIDEGGTVTLSGSYADASTVDTHTLVINWGDGDTGNVAVNAADKTFTATHQYRNNPAAAPFTYTIGATVRDSAGGTGTSSLDVTVNNVAPVVNAGTDLTGQEGSEISFTGSFTDVGTLDTHTIEWDFGDGSTATGALTPKHVYADNRDYTVTLKVTDSDGAAQSDTLVVRVSNVAPTLTVPVAQETDEGATLRLDPIGQFTDPGFTSATAGTQETFTYSINWGDGTAANTGTATITQAGSAGVLTAGSFAGNHTFADNGLYTVTVVVTDDDGGRTQQTFDVNVRNVAPTLFTSGNKQVTVGVAANLVDLGTFTDPGFANPLNTGGERDETFEYTIDWGDGTAVSRGSATVDRQGSPGFPTEGSFDGLHVYGTAGNFQVVVRLSDDDGGTDEQAFTIVAVEAAPAQGEGGAQLLALGPFVMPDGEPSVPSLLADAPAAELEAVNEAPILFGPGDLTITEGAFDYIDLGVFWDNDSVGPFQYSIDWGDGSPATTGTATVDLPGPPTAGSFDGSHVYTEGTYSLVLSVTDEQGDTSTETFVLTVNDTLPTFGAITVNSPILEGGTAKVTGSIVDEGTMDSHTVFVNWDDGSTETYDYVGGATTFEITHVYLNNKPDNAPYNVRLEVRQAGQVEPPDTADLAIVVQNVAPTAVNDIYTHIDGGDLVIDATHGVLANDLDPGTDTLSAFDFSTPSVGTLVGNEDGSFTYTPPEVDFSGVVRFTYKTRDSDGAVSVSTARVTIDASLSAVITGFVRAKRSNGVAIGLPGVILTLTEATSKDRVRITTITGDDGSYRFGGLRAGTYTITETQPAAFNTGGTDTRTVELEGEDTQSDINFEDGWLKTQFVSVRNFLATGGLLSESTPGSDVRLLVARGEEQAGNLIQAAAIRAGGAQTTGIVTGTAGADTLEFLAGAKFHKVYWGDELPYVFVAEEVEQILIDGAGGVDSIRLVGSAANDIFRLRTANALSTLQAAGYRVGVTGVEQITAQGGNGYDRAYMYDSLGNDLLTYGGDTARLAYAGTTDRWVAADGVEWVRAVGTAGGLNTKQSTGAIDFVLETEGNWTDL
jgi:PKD repeat protein